jgi:hypothetical protein
LLARSLRAGCGSRGPASGFSSGVVTLGFAHVIAQWRAAYFGNSHIRGQPADVFEDEHPQ